MAFRTVNVVSTADFRCKIDLARVGRLDGGRFEPERYACAYMKRPTMTGRVTIFGNGKAISVGTKSVTQSRNELRLVAQILKKEAGFPVSISPVKVQNVVVNGDFARPFDLEHLYLELSGSTFEPEVFPALIWRPPDLSLTILVFSSGKFVATLRNVSQIPVLNSYLRSHLLRIPETIRVARHGGSRGPILPAD